MKYARVKRYNYGGTIAQAGTTVGEVLKKTAYNPNGSVNDGRYIAGAALSRSAQGAGIGTMIAPGVGTLIGAGVGAIAGVFEGVKGSKKMMAERDAQLQAEEEERLRLQAEQEEQARLQAEYEAEQQNIYNQNYYTDPTKNTRGIAGASIYAKYGAKLPVKGGALKYVAHDTAVAQGNTHEEGGIKINSGGRQLAEIEDGEIIDGDKVFSDTLKLPNGKTIAKEAMKYAKIKGKMEEKLSSTDFRSRNTAQRMTDNSDKALEGLFNYQQAKNGNFPRKMRMGGKMSYDPGGNLPYGPYPREVDPYSQAHNASYSENPPYSQGSNTDGIMTRGPLQPGAYEQAMSQYEASQNPPEEDYTDDSLEAFWKSDKSAMPETGTGSGLGAGGGSGSRFSMGKAGDVLNQGLEIVTPFIDNIINKRLQQEAPEVPRPVMRKALTLKGAPLPTTYDISRSLSDVNDAYRSFTQNTDLTTNNSQVARGNKANAFAKTLKAKGDLYQHKGNMETQMVANSIRNNQQISAMNLRNKQDIDNINAGLTDQYNMNKYIREDRLLDARSANAANATEDARTLINDRNMRSLDNERMLISSLEDPSGSGLARMMGTKTMDKWASDPYASDKIEETLERAGQTKALKEYRAKYRKGK